MKVERKVFEKKEQPLNYDLKVDWVRHGQPEYSEAEKASGNFQGELTEVGRQQVAQAAKELINGHQASQAL